MTNNKAKILSLQLILILYFLSLLPSMVQAQECWFLSPFYGYQGDTNSEVEIHTLDANFVQGDTQVSFNNPGITVNSTVVNHPNKLTVTIDIEEDAPIGRFNITVTTGSEVIVCEDEGDPDYPENDDAFEVR